MYLDSDGSGSSIEDQKQKMKVLSVGHAVPETRLSNAEYLDLVMERNRGRVPGEQLEFFRAMIERGFEVTGNEHRYLALNGETALDFGQRASELALKRAGMDARDVDLVLYVGVSRGCIEPATAYVFQNAVGAVNATSFDILDACAGWLRGMHVVHSLLSAGTYRTALLVNCEMGWDYFMQREFSTAAALDHYFAAFTLGEAATATVVQADANDDFRFHIRSFPEYYDLCTIPLHSAPLFGFDGLQRGMEPGFFAAQSTALASATIKCAIKTFEDEPSFFNDNYDIFFAHVASKKGGDIVARKIGLPMSRHFATHQSHGNTASCAIPLAMSLATEQGQLRRGNRVLVAVSSAGISIGVASFTF